MGFDTLPYMEHIGQMGFLVKDFFKVFNSIWDDDLNWQRYIFQWAGPTHQIWCGYRANRKKMGYDFLRILRTIWRYHGISNQQCDRWIVRQWRICFKSCSFDRKNDVSKCGFQADFSHKNPCELGVAEILVMCRWRHALSGVIFMVMYIWCMYTVT